MRMFNFSCYALLRRFEDSDDEPELLGFWYGADAVYLAERGSETLRKAEHQKLYESWPWPTCRPVLPVAHYAVLALRDVDFDSLEDLNSKLIQAAKLQWAGIGVR